MPQRVKGRIRSAGTTSPVANLSVEVHSVPANAPAGSLENSEIVGSGRTGADGNFVIDVPDHPASPNAPKRRLVTAVYADDSHAGAPLVLSRPRAEGVALDDLDLRVPAVPTPRAPQVAQSQGEVAAGLIKTRDAARKSLQAATAAELKRRVTQRKQGRELADRVLSKPAKGTAPRSRFVPRTTSPTKALQDARTAGVKRLGTITPPGMAVRLDAATLKKIAPDGLSSKALPVPKATAEKIQSSATSGAGASRLRDLLTMCRAELRRDRTRAGLDDSTAAETVTDATSTTSPESESSSAATRTELLERLRAIVLHSNTAAASPAGIDLAAVERGLALELPTGPADTTAFYDFSSLHVAWEDTWTAVLDSLTVTQLADLYDSLVDVVDPKNIKLDTSESAELEQLLEDVADAIAVASTTPGVSCPMDIGTWLPEAVAAWPALSAEEQEWIRFFYSCDALYGLLGATGIRDIQQQGKLTVNDLLTGTYPEEWMKDVSLDDLGPDYGKNRARDFLEAVEDAEVEPSGLTRATGLLDGLTKKLTQPYKFDVFVPDSYNYGILTTYRQRWKPLAYQVGDLVASMPMAPGETRSFETHKVVKTTRAQKEIEKSLVSRTGESTTTGRAESEIVQKASNATNFAMSGQGSISVGFASIGASSQFGANQSGDSAQTKRDVREATEKAAQEYRDERTIEITSEESVTGETTEKRTISNPNNEITVTYLFYELQRRFEVAERLESVKPVVLVAFQVPQPDHIDETWLVQHEWILRKVILHDRFLPALDSLTESFAGEEIGVEIKKAQWEAQMSVVQTLSDNVSMSTRLRDASRRALLDATESVAGKDGLIKNLGQALFPSGPEDSEVQSAQREAAQRSLEWVSADFAVAQSRLEAAVNALRQATDDYTHAVEQRTNRRVGIDQLKLHVKQNVFYYMQAIWAHEPADQRYFRLYDLPVQWPKVDPAGYTVSAWTPPPTIHLHSLGTLPRPIEEESPGPNAQLIVPAPTLGPERPLHQVADLDTLLGFKGNYAIFPLKEDNGITTYMSQAYFDDYFGVMDPDPFGRIPTTTEALALAECAWNRKGTTDADRTELTQWLLDVMANQANVSEELIVPTGQLFIEALPGAHPLLETFKLQHRALDVTRAVTDGKMREVELLRRAARLVQGDLSDAEVDSRVEITGAAGVTVSVPPAGESGV